jgi:hypothetical protein
LEPVSIVDPNILAATADKHFGTPLSWLVQSIGCVQIAYLLALIVSIADQRERSVQLQLSDLWFSEFGFSELFGDHIVFRLVDGWQVDMQWDCTAFLVCLPQVAFEFSIECRLARTRFT